MGFEKENKLGFIVIHVDMYRYLKICGWMHHSMLVESKHKRRLIKARCVALVSRIAYVRGALFEEVD